jgi:hypothetical protein
MFPRFTFGLLGLGGPHPVHDMHEKVIEVERIDDGEIFSLNEDDGSYSMDKSRESMPTCFYRYSLERLLGTGAFRIKTKEKINE